MSKIQEIEKRWSEATPGPWVFIPLDLNGETAYFVTNRELLYQQPPLYVCDVAKAKIAAIAGDEAEDTSNAQAIANAPSDVAYLLAEVKRLKDGIKRLQNFVCLCHEMHPDQYSCSTCIQADEILKEAAQ